MLNLDGQIMKFIKSLFLPLLIFPITVQSQSITFSLKKNNTISQTLIDNINRKHPHYSGLYGPSSFLQQVLDFNKLNLESARRLPPEYEIQIPPHLNKFFILADHPAKVPSPPIKIAAASDSNYKFSFSGSLLAGSYFHNETILRRTGGNIVAQRNLQPILGSDIELAWKSDEEQLGLNNRIYLTQFIGSPTLPLEVNFEGKLFYSGLLIGKFLPLLRFDYEKYYFFSGPVSNPYSTKFTGFFPGLGATYPLTFGSYSLRLGLTYGRSLSTSAQFREGSQSFTGSKTHGWLHHKLSKQFFVEAHGQVYHLEGDDDTLKTTRIFALIGWKL
jgi:hypothetical protein